MPDVILKVENIRKAHAQGCRDVKKVLETLCPEVFMVKYPCFKKYTGNDGKTFIVRFTAPKSGAVVVDDYNVWGFGTKSDTWAESTFTPIKGIQEIP